MIQSVARAVYILEYISKHHMVGLSEISRGVGLNKSTTHGLVATLELMDCIRQDQTTGKYTLGLKLLELGQAVLSHMDIRAIAMPHLVHLARKYEETVHLAVLSHDEVVYIDKVDSPRSIRHISQVGGRNPAYCTGVGKVLLAGLSDQKLQKLLKKIKFRQYTPNTISDMNLLKKHLRKVHKDGYALDQEEIEVGLSCVAAPIKNYRDNVIAAISLAGPTSRIANDSLHQLIADVTEIARLISIQLGYKD